MGFPVNFLNLIIFKLYCIQAEGSLEHRFWELKILSFCSCAWWKLLKLRRIAYPLCKISIWDSRSTVFRFDNQTGESPLDAQFNIKHGIPLYTTVTKAVNDQRWFQGSFPEKDKKELQSLLMSIQLYEGKRDKSDSG